MRVAWAVPTLPNVPRQPRGESNPPSVLMFTGGALPGVSVVEPLAVAVVAAGFGVDRQEAAGFEVEHPHRQRVVDEQQPMEVLVVIALGHPEVP